MTPVETVRDALELARGMVTQDADAQATLEDALRALDELGLALAFYARASDYDREMDAGYTAQMVLGTGAPQGATTPSPDVGAVP